MASLFEPYVQLVDVTATAALAAWGGFVLEEHGDAWRARRTGETFGARSVPVGRAAVEVLVGDGTVVARQATDDANHVWVEGLRPSTTYRYRVPARPGRRGAAGQRQAGTANWRDRKRWSAEEVITWLSASPPHPLQSRSSLAPAGDGRFRSREPPARRRS